MIKGGFLFVVILTLLIGGCDLSQLSDEDLERLSDKLIVCDPPYLRHGSDCCLDKNENLVCDEDEGFEDGGDEEHDKDDDDNKDENDEDDNAKKSFTFDITNLDKLTNVRLFFTAEEHSGRLKIQINGHVIHNTEVKTNKKQKLDIPLKYLKQKNTLTFSIIPNTASGLEKVSGDAVKEVETPFPDIIFIQEKGEKELLKADPFSIKKNNYKYSLKGVLVIADVKAGSTKDVPHTFTISEEVAEHMTSANLHFTPKCTKSKELLIISINDVTVFSAIPSCNAEKVQGISPLTIKEGENKALFSTGTEEYTLDNVFLTIEYNVSEPSCGNSQIEQGEECDDGNTVSGDGCSSTCTNETTIVCGDGTVDEGEECDDGNIISGDGCSSECDTEEIELDGKIFFESDKSGTTYIWMMDPDGSNVVQVTDRNGFIDSQPHVSPDGATLVFSRADTSLGVGCFDIWMRDLETGTETRLLEASSSVGYSEPFWDPNGNSIVFVQGVPNGCGGAYVPDSQRLWIMDVFPTPGNPSQLSPESTHGRFWPNWAPDGSNIVHGKKVSGYNPFTLYKTIVSTGVETEIIPHVAGEYQPHYSPDGSKITWTSFRDDQYAHGDIYMLEASSPTTTICRVTPETGYQDAAWSPDGNKLIMRHRPSSSELSIAIGDPSCGAVLPTVIYDEDGVSVGAPWWADVDGDVFLGTPPYCGDGNVDQGEECDDGNNDGGDGCSSNCETEVQGTNPTFGWEFSEGSGTTTSDLFGSKDLSFACSGGTAPSWSSDFPTFGDGTTTGGPHSIKIGGVTGDGKLHTTLKPSDYPNGFTLNMWLKGDGLAINWHSLPGVNYANWHVQVNELDGGTLRWQVGCGAEYCPSGPYHDREVTGMGWDVDTWAMVTIKQNQTHDCGYVNGDLLGCFDTDHFAGHRDDLMLGGERFPSDCRSSFDGNIDHVYIFTNTGGLPDKEIKNLYLYGDTTP